MDFSSNFLVEINEHETVAFRLVLAFAIQQL